MTSRRTILCNGLLGVSKLLYCNILCSDWGFAAGAGVRMPRDRDRAKGMAAEVRAGAASAQRAKVDALPAPPDQSDARLLDGWAGEARDECPVSRCTPVARWIRRSDQPSRPSVRTCSCCPVLKTMAIPVWQPRGPRGVKVRDLPHGLASFQVTPTSLSCQSSEASPEAAPSTGCYPWMRCRSESLLHQDRSGSPCPARPWRDQGRGSRPSLPRPAPRAVRLRWQATTRVPTSEMSSAVWLWRPR